jgi:hypothetical protein
MTTRTPAIPATTSLTLSHRLMLGALFLALGFVFVGGGRGGGGFLGP